MSQSTNILTTLSNQMADAVERIAPALVLVNGRQRQPASGIVFAPELVLTADHVIEREEELTIVTDDGRELAAQFVGRDPASDLAVLRVAGLARDAATIASEDARVGQFVLAVGRPSHTGPMASLGIVSSVAGPVRTGRGAMIEQVIQTDATPYPGFSGGPLISPEGIVIGIVTTGLINGVALALPAKLALHIAETITQHGSVQRGYLGISSQPVAIPEAQRAGKTQERGLLIVHVESDSPASKGGLLLGDILVTLDGQTVTDTDDVQALLSGERVGKSIPVEVLRGGTLATAQVTVGRRN